jgi:hypothetical protein
MVGAVERDESCTAGVLTRDFERALDSFGAAVGEIDARKAVRQHLGQPRGKLHLSLDHILAVYHHVQMTARLLLDGADHSRMAVAESGHSDS